MGDDGFDVFECFGFRSVNVFDVCMGMWVV